MNKRDKSKLAKAIARAPAPGHCPLAPPRNAIWRMNRLRSEHARMARAVRQASVDLNKALLLEEDLRMRVAFLENKLKTLDHAAN